MTRDDVKLLISNYYRYKNQIHYMEVQIEFWRSKAAKITASYSQDAGSTPINNPKSSKVEEYAVMIADYEEKLSQIKRLAAAVEEYFSMLSSHQVYLVKCLICNHMSYKEFAVKNHMKTESVRRNLYRILDKLADE